ncbi:FHA domain-containing protein [Cyanobacteria bacterium FACHB-63]|nr:FHA domain-containing protein [Cyanobacteria bacterium FACHB-63]
MKVTVLNADTQAAIKELNLIHAIIEGGTCFIGRGQSSGLVLDSPRVSRLHAQFSRQDGQYYFSDLGSSNGSTVQGEAAIASQPYLLHPGDVIRIGEFILMLEAVPEPLEEPEATVIGSIDATVVNFTIPATIEPDEPEPEEVLDVEVLPAESSALVKIESESMSPSPAAQTQALFAAINQRVVAELKAAGNLTRDTYLKAIQRAKDSIENKRLIDPDQFEKEANKYWQSIAKGSTELGGQLGAATLKGAAEVSKRLGAAAKAAWKEVVSPQKRENKPKESESPIIEEASEMNNQGDSTDAENPQN